MSLIKLTKDLESFQWTDYSKAGTGKSPQPDGTDYFERPNPKSLDQMESKFGQLDTKPTFRGPYGVSNVMDGEKQGRGFIPPGSSPSGFTKDMDLLHNPSELAIGQNLTRTPLSYEIAGVTSNLSYGQVNQKELNLEPAAKGAWGNTTLPISTYSSRQPIEGIPVGAIGGSNTYYGNLDLLSSRTSNFQKPDGSYTTPEEPLFEGGQRTFLIPAAYPKNTTAYSINNQFGWTHQNSYLEIHGTAWRGFGLTTTVQGQMDEAGYEDVTPDFYPPLPEQSQTPHPMNRLYLNSEPAYGAPSWLETQFLINYGVTDGIWPYKVLGFTGTHPLIKKDIGERYQIGGVENWMALQVVRTADDIERVEKWLDTPKGELWINTQQILQELNPREETRTFSLSSITTSVPPFIHAKRHGGIFGGETYMDVADFGPIFEGDPPQGGPTLGSILESKFPKLVGRLKTAEEGMDWITSGLDRIGSTLGMIDFNEQGAGGRLRFLRDRFISGNTGGDSTILGFNMTQGLNNSSPFGRPPKIPTQTVFSQKGTYGRGRANENVLKNETGDVLQKYKTLAYGQLNKSNQYLVESEGYNHILSAGENTRFEVSMENFDTNTVRNINRRLGRKIVNDIGNQGRTLDPEIYKITVDDVNANGGGLGVIKKGAAGKYNNELTDKINMLPYGQDYKDAKDGAVNDFIKFKFYDIENKKHIIFRAILSGISDSITPEWTGTRYIGRPDQVYV